MREDIPAGTASGISTRLIDVGGIANPRRLADKRSGRFGRIKGAKP
jgi:hypothetical protein